MTTLSDAAKTALRAHLENKLITIIDEGDMARADIIKIGPLQGDPELEDSPICVEIYQNDPDKPDEWFDEIIEWEMPRTAVWSRKFTILYRTLLTESGESLAVGLSIASTVKARLEVALNNIDWGAISVDGESIESCPLEDMESTLAQGGGPDEYDYSGKIRFSVITRAFYS